MHRSRATSVDGVGPSCNHHVNRRRWCVRSDFTKIHVGRSGGDGQRVTSSPIRQDVLWSHSTYLWEDEAGVVHTVEHGEGGELMPLLYPLGQHAALKSVQEGLHEDERLFAFLDDIYAVTSPERVGDVHALLSTHLRRCSSIRINVGKTHV